MWGLMFMLGMALVSGFASVPGVRYSAVPQEVGPHALFLRSTATQLSGLLQMLWQMQLVSG